MSHRAEPTPIITFLRRPLARLEENNLSRGYWRYFAAALFFDAGFCIYFFIFNLYLLDLHFNERFIGLVSGAMTLGGVLVMLPAGMLSRRIGVQRVLVLCYIAAPLIHIARALWVWAPAQLALAVLGGMALSSGGICYLPVVARLTTEKNRTAGFSLIFAASLASSALGGVMCGSLPGWLQHAGAVISAAELKRIILIASCAVALIGVIPAIRLGLPQTTEDEPRGLNQILKWPTVSPAVIRLVVPLTLWAIVLAAFFPFGNVYLSAHLHLPLNRISFIFSIAQVVQLCMLLATPIVLRAMGRLNGLLVIQALTGVTLGLLACTTRSVAAVPLFLLFSALQWMANPGLYDAMMSSTPDAERESASAIMLLCNAVVSALTTLCAGALYTRFGYRAPMLGVAIVASVAALISRFLLAARTSERNGGAAARRTPTYERATAR